MFKIFEKYFGTPRSGYSKLIEILIQGRKRISHVVVLYQ